MFSRAILFSVISGFIGVVSSGSGSLAAVVFDLPCGRGFTLLLDGRLVDATANHVIAVCRKGKACPVGWEKLEGKDVAIRENSGDVEGAFIYAGEAVEVGDRVIALLVRGEVETVVVKVEPTGKFEVQAEFCKGDSGSPILNVDGSVVGLVVAKKGSRLSKCGSPGIAETLAQGAKRHSNDRRLRSGGSETPRKLLRRPSRRFSREILSREDRQRQRSNRSRSGRRRLGG